MKVPSGLGALSEWVKPTEIYCTSEGCVPSVPLWSFFFFAQLRSQMCGADKSVAPTPNLAGDPCRPPGTAAKGNRSCVWNSPCSHLLRFVIASNPTQASICCPPLQLPVRQAAIGQNTSRTRLMHSTWIKDPVTCRYRACSVVSMFFCVSAAATSGRWGISVRTQPHPRGDRGGSLQTTPGYEYLFI